MDGRSAEYKAGTRGFAKAGGKNVPCSSGLPQRNVYTGGRAITKSKSIYGQTPKQTVTPRALSKGDIALAGTRQTHVLGKRDY
jgi:hypothetical protein